MERGRERRRSIMSVGAVAVTPRPAWKPWLAAAVGVVAAFFALGLIADAFTPAPSGPAGSSYATSPAGAAAWAELLTRSGHPVAQLRRPLDDVALPPAATLIMLGADSLSPAAGQNLDRFVRAGGRLVIGGGDPPATLPALLPRAPGWTDSGSVLVKRVAFLPEVDGVNSVRTAGDGAWTSGPGTPALAGTRGPALLVLRAGRGRVDLLADAAPVENQLLASADNAQLALNLAGPRGCPGDLRRGAPRLRRGHRPGGDSDAVVGGVRGAVPGVGGVGARARPADRSRRRAGSRAGPAAQRVRRGARAGDRPRARPSGPGRPDRRGGQATRGVRVDAPARTSPEAVVKDLYERVRAEVGAVVVGQDEVLAQLLGALACTATS